jgi:hypothetical protein
MQDDVAATLRDSALFRARSSEIFSDTASSGIASQWSGRPAPELPARELPTPEKDLFLGHAPLKPEVRQMIRELAFRPSLWAGVDQSADGLRI